MREIDRISEVVCADSKAIYSEKNRTRYLANEVPPYAPVMIDISVIPT